MQSTRTATAATLLAAAFLLAGCPIHDDAKAQPHQPLLSDSKLPRFTRLDKFDPHRKDFLCKHEADANRPSRQKPKHCSSRRWRW
ncbi:MAG TPA: hypothetical protein VN280_23390 [Variovorax sp.]|nr:hypothetical protein [Variovorax sp.]